MGRIRTGTLCSVSDSVDVGKSEQVVETAKCKTGVVSSSDGVEKCKAEYYREEVTGAQGIVCGLK